MKKEEIIKALRELDEDERLEVLSFFCPWCGEYAYERICQCWNDV